MPEPTPALVNASTGTLNNVATTDSEGNFVSAVRFTGVAPTVTGLASPDPGRRIHLIAVGGPLILSHENAGSVAAQRFDLASGANVTIPQKGSAWLVYDADSSRWRLSVDGGGGGGSTPTGTGFRHVTSGVEDAAATANMTYAGGGCVFNASGFASFGAAPATAGPVRLSNNTFITALTTGAANKSILGLDNSNYITLGSSGNGFVQVLQGGGSDALMSLPDGSSWRLTAGVLSQNVPIALNVAAGTLPAIGLIRIPYVASDTIIGAKDSGGTDRNVLSRPSADTIRLGDSAVRTYFTLGADSQWISNTGEIVIQTSGANQPIYLAHGGPLVCKFNGTEYERTVSADVQTTDATVTTIATGTIANGTSVTVEADVNGLRSTFAEAAGYKRIATFRNNAGTVNQVGTTSTPHTAEDDATWDCTIDFNGTSWRVRVTGAAAKTINWRAGVRVTLRN